MHIILKEIQINLNSNNNNMPISIVAGKINNIQYEKYGSDENNVILFIHGGIGGIYTFITGKLHCQKVGICSAESKTPMYASLINKLVKGNNYSVLAYDRRGCGNNRINIGNVNEWFTMEDCVNDIFTLLKHCNYLKKKNSCHWYFSRWTNSYAFMFETFIIYKIINFVKYNR